MSSSWNFKNNLTIDNSKYLNWLDPKGIRNSIIGLDVNSNVNLNSAFGKGDLYINSNSSTGSTFLNFNNIRNVLIASRLGVGITNTSNMNANLVLPANGFIGTNSSSGFLGLVGSSSTSGSRIIMYGDGQLNLHASSVSTGSINFFTGEDLQKRMEIQSSGTINITPDGSSSPSVSINSDACYFENKIIILNSTQSMSATDGALQVAGGVGVVGDVHIDGTLSISSVTGNLNFNNSQSSTSYSSGAIFLSGGIGITCSQEAGSQTSGGAISAAGGLALGKNAMIGGNVMIFDTTKSISSFTGALVSYGGTGLNGQLNIRTNKMSQIRLANIYTGDETSIMFSAINNYSTGGSWKIGQNVNSIGTGNFGIINDATTYALFDGINQKIKFYKDIQSANSITAANINFTGDLYKNGLPYVGSQWAGSGGSKIYYGNYVGIGTSDPGYNLDVAGDLNFNGDLYKNGSIYVGSQWSGSTGSQIYFDNYVGIGTTNPMYALDVNGTARIENLIYTNITTSNVYLNTVNLAGISKYYSGTFSAANNISVAAGITGLLFPSGTVRSFVATLAISVTQSIGQNYYSQYTIDGVQTNSGWQIFPTAIGDSIDIIFSIDSSTGQLKYVSPNLPNWSSTIMNYDVKTITMNVGYTPTITTSANLNITGQISTSNTTDSISSSTGALTVSGGVGITKTLSVGGDLIVNENRLFGAKFNASNNVITDTAITNLIFPSASYRSFSLLMSVALSASSNLYSQYTINGIQGASGWSIFTDIIGDVIDINFSINSTTGQMLYTAPTNYADWSRTLINYHATALSK